MSHSRRSRKKRKATRKRRNCSTKTDDFGFIDCPVAGAVFVETRKGNCLYVFDSIGFVATDIHGKSFEIEGLIFDQEKGWYDSNEVIPKYYGKSVYPACNEYAADIAIRDDLLLGLALFGRERPAKGVLMLSRDEIIKRLESRCGIAS